jgi:TIGR03009 family protein
MRTLRYTLPLAVVLTVLASSFSQTPTTGTPTSAGTPAVKGTVPGVGTAATANSSGTAKTPPAVEAPKEVPNPRLDAYLAAWEKKMREIKSLSARIGRTEKDSSFGTAVEVQGTAHYLKVGGEGTAQNLALLELFHKGKSDLADKYVCTGTYLYQFKPGSKEIVANELPKPKPGQVADDNFLGFLFGMKAEEAKRRYFLTLYKEDKNFVYVDIAPRFAADKADFVRARLVLNQGTFLPRRLWFEGVGKETTWDIPAMQVDPPNMDRRIFDQPKTPAGWTFKVAPRPTEVPTPRVIRPSSK